MICAASWRDCEFRSCSSSFGILYLSTCLYRESYDSGRRLVCGSACFVQPALGATDLSVLCRADHAHALKVLSHLSPYTNRAPLLWDVCTRQGRAGQDEAYFETRTLCGWRVPKAPALLSPQYSGLVYLFLYFAPVFVCAPFVVQAYVLLREVRAVRFVRILCVICVFQPVFRVFSSVCFVFVACVFRCVCFLCVCMDWHTQVF